MSFRHLFLIAVLFGGCLQANAQKKLLLSLTPIPLDLPNRQFFVDSISDERNAGNDIGVIHGGHGVDSTVVEFSSSFADAAANYFKRVIPVAPGQERIIAVINQCKISDQTERPEHRNSADVTIAFSRLDSGRLYILDEYSSHQEGTGTDIISLAERLALAINSCIEQFSKSGFRYNTGVGFQGVENWMASDPEHDILHCKYKKRGTYSSFTSLRSNTPDEKQVYLKPKKDRFTAMETETGKMIETAFGVCDGFEIYINTYIYNHYNSAKGLYAQVLETGRYMIWKDRYIGLGEMLAVGRFISGAYKDLIAMDMKNGTIIPITSSSLQKILADDPELLAKYKVAVKNWELPVMQAFLKSYNEKHPL